MSSLSVRQMIQETVKHCPDPTLFDDPHKWETLVQWVRSYFGEELNSETIRRTACKMREVQRYNFAGFS